MTDPRRETDWVDDLLDDVAREPVAGPSGDLMARVLADSTAMLPAPGGARAGPFAQLVAGIGGWFSLGGLVAATAFGFAVGLGALNSGGIETLWSGAYSAYYEETLGFSVNGWDFEEG